jgi:hypothetical protein
MMSFEHTPSVLILGPGASQPYGLPSRTQLIRDVCELIATANSSELRRHPVARLFWDALQRKPSPKGSNEWAVWEGEDARLLQIDGATTRVPGLDSFLELLRSLNVPSMTAFLAQDFGPRQALFSYMGRLAVATIIATRERVSGLDQAFEQGRQQDWYGVLWESLMASAAQNGQRIPAGLPPQLKIISFNPDRSLEFFLARGLGATQLLQSKQTPRLSDMLTLGRDIASESILHIGGSLGPLTHVPFGASLEAQPDPGRLCEMAHHLRYWGLDARTSNEKVLEKTLAKARSWIEASERVAFLGMDFDPQQLAQLGFSPSTLGDELPVPVTAPPSAENEREESTPAAPTSASTSAAAPPSASLRWSELTRRIGWVKGTMAYFKQAAPAVLTTPLMGQVTPLLPKALYATTTGMSTGEILRFTEQLGMWTSSSGQVCRTYVPTEVGVDGSTSMAVPVIRQRGDATDSTQATQTISHHLYAYRLLPGL